MEIELTDSLGLGRKVGIVAVEPIHTAMRLEIGLLQDTPDAGATQAMQPLLPECGDQVIETPPGGGAMIRGRFLGRHRQDLDTFRGGKCAAGVPSAAHLAGPGSRAPGSADATGQPYGAHRPSRWPRADWRGGLARRFGGSADSERPTLGEWNGRAQAIPNGRAPQGAGPLDAPGVWA